MVHIPLVHSSSWSTSACGSFQSMVHSYPQSTIHSPLQPTVHSSPRFISMRSTLDLRSTQPLSMVVVHSSSRSSPLLSSLFQSFQSTFHSSTHSTLVHFSRQWFNPVQDPILGLLQFTVHSSPHSTPVYGPLIRSTTVYDSLLSTVYSGSQSTMSLFHTSSLQSIFHDPLQSTFNG